MATAFTLNPTEAKSFAPPKLKKSFETLLKGIPEKNLFFADSNWTKSASKQWQAKTSQANITAISKKTGASIDQKGNIVVELSGFKLKFVKSNKKSAGGGIGAADAKTTRMQELGSAWIIRRAIKDNIRYKDWQSIRKDPKYPELVAIYPAVDDDPEWLQGYYAQQKKMLQEFASTSFDEFNREGGFMDYISDLVSKKYGIKQKDTWNPADIWLVKNETQVINDIEKATSGSSATQSILELNAIMRRMFKDRRLVGISLKKISGKVAQYEEFNVDNATLPEDFTYDLKTIKIDLSFANGQFGTQDARIIVIGKGVEYNFQVKGNDSSKMSNLKYEPTQKGASAARVGKAPVDMVQKLMGEVGMKFVNDNKLFPQTLDAFSEYKDDYIKCYQKARSNGVDTSVASADEFIQNIEEGFMSAKPHVATAKLMELKFIESLLKLSKKDRDAFMTDMVFIAAKKGARFGPFGKLY